MQMVPAEYEPPRFHPDGHQSLAAAVGRAGVLVHGEVAEGRFERTFSYWSKDLSFAQHELCGSSCLFGQKLSLKGEDTYLLKEALRYLLLHTNKGSPTATALLRTRPPCSVPPEHVKSVNEQLVL